MRPRRSRIPLGTCLVVLAAVRAPVADAGPTTDAGPTAYRSPARSIAALVDVPPTPAASLGPDLRTLVLLEQPTLPTIAEVAEPELRLAGLRINPRTSGPSRRSYLSGLLLLDVRDASAAPRAVTGLPVGARIADVRWSPDGARLAFTVTGDDAISLWVAEVKTARAWRLLPDRLNGAAGAPFEWRSDGAIVARLVPAGRGEPPARARVPTGPRVQENDGRKRPARTNPDVLRDEHDDALLEYHLRSQLAVITPDGKPTSIGAPDLHVAAAPSPDAAHLLVAAIHRPFSRKVGIDRFPLRVDAWSASGRLERRLADLPLAEEVPIDFAAVRTGRRGFEWRADADATLCFTEARDGGDPKRAAAVRDELSCWAAPWRGRPVKLVALALRSGGIRWGSGRTALVTEWWWTDRKTRTWVVAPDAPRAAPRKLWDRSSEDRYTDPGEPVLRRTPRGTQVLHTTPGGALLLVGAGASAEGDRPFLDELDLGTGATRRRFRSAAPAYEMPVAIADDAGALVLTRRETAAEPPQYHLRADGAAPRALTRFPHPHPALSRVGKRLITYRRADGVALSGMLYLPPGFVPGRDRPLPLLMWAYPSEFKSRAAAGQVQDSPHRFVRAHPHGPLFALLLGFAVLDDPSFPIVGEGTTEPNDSYVAQLVAGAGAAVDEVVRLGVADRDRIAIGGHSYGAFTAVNLLAHSDLFRAAIARSGAYNRTLTPFGFQSEERSLWQARQTYQDMSPFSYADKIDEPLLLIHGEVDDNSGTYPIQSERLFEAMTGLGGRVRYVVLPAEAHGYRARESVLHVLFEMSGWLERNVARARPRRGASPPPRTAAP
jgi:dipeptidyl aminopeptidase/acylaminoacyl peptidase